jgi:uncharacterized protein (TIGR03083 family)
VASDDLDFIATTRLEAERCSQLARTVPHDVRLEHLPGWSAGDLVAHLAGDFRWATKIITTRSWDGVALSSVAERGEQLCALFDVLIGEMVEALATAEREPDALCPNFAERKAGRLRFWPRHQAHETTIHRWDLEVPTGAHAPIDPTFAADGVDEVLHTYARRYRGFHVDEPFTVRCRGLDAAWSISPRPGARIEVRRGPGLVEADVEADADALLLVAWHRLDPDEAGLTFRSRERAARAFLRGPVTA